MELKMYQRKKIDKDSNSTITMYVVAYLVGVFTI